MDRTRKNLLAGHNNSEKWSFINLWEAKKLLQMFCLNIDTKDLTEILFTQMCEKKISFVAKIFNLSFYVIAEKLGQTWMRFNVK